jgi:Ca2+-binding EF-hand superfamily protein
MSTRAEESKERKAQWLQAPRPNLNVEQFLHSFIGHPAPVDVNEDGFVDKKELLTKMMECGATDQEECQIIIDSFFDVLDPESKGLIRTDVFEKVYLRMGQYNAVSWIKELYHLGQLDMYTKADGKTDVFFTKDELKEAFAVQIGTQAANRQVDRTFSDLDTNSSSYVGSDKLKAWYFSANNADLRAISLRRRSRSVAQQGTCVVDHAKLLEQIEAQIGQLLVLTETKSKKEKRKLKDKESAENVVLNRLVNRLHGIHDFMQAINVEDENGRSVFDHIVSDAIMVPIQEAYRMGAVDPNAPPPAEEEESD